MWLMILILLGLAGLAIGMDYFLSGSGYSKKRKQTDIDNHKTEKEQFHRNAGGRM